MINKQPTAADPALNGHTPRFRFAPNAAVYKVLNSAGLGVIQGNGRITDGKAYYDVMWVDGSGLEEGIPESELSDVQPIPDNPQPNANGSGATANQRTQNTSQANSNMPPLPQSAQIDPALGKDASPWLDAYIEYSRLASPRAYELFHEAIGLWVLSTVAARRVKLQWGRKHFYTNLNLAIVAPTTLYAKTTTAQAGEELIKAAGLEHLLLSGDLTPQAFINDMALHVDSSYGDMNPNQQEQEKKRLTFVGQQGWYFDEFGEKLKAIKRENGVMADYHKIFLVLDNNPPTYKYKTLTRRDHIEQPYLALLANMTPVHLKPFARRDGELWQDGFLARFAFIVPPTNEPLPLGRLLDHDMPIPQELIKPVQEWHKRLGIPYVDILKVTDANNKVTSHSVIRDLQPLSCASDTAVFEAFYAYHDGLTAIAYEEMQQGNHDLNGNYGRFAEKAMRIAILLASLENNNRIGLEHWARAQTITERWRQCLHDLVDQLAADNPTEESRREEKIINILNRHVPTKGALSANDIKRFTSFSISEVDQLCRRLSQLGVIKAISTGRTIKYEPN